MAWLIGWNRRKSKTINYFQSNYQMKLSNDDFGDIRFTG